MRLGVLSTLRLATSWGSLWRAAADDGSVRARDVRNSGTRASGQTTALVCTDVCGLSRASSARLLFNRSARKDTLRPIFSAWVQPPVRQAFAKTLCYRDGHRYW